MQNCSDGDQIRSRKIKIKTVSTSNNSVREPETFYQVVITGQAGGSLTFWFEKSDWDGTVVKMPHEKEWDMACKLMGQQWAVGRYSEIKALILNHLGAQTKFVREGSVVDAYKDNFPTLKIFLDALVDPAKSRLVLKVAGAPPYERTAACAVENVLAGNPAFVGRKIIIALPRDIHVEMPLGQLLLIQESESALTQYLDSQSILRCRSMVLLTEQELMDLVAAE